MSSPSAGVTCHHELARRRRHVDRRHPAGMVAVEADGDAQQAGQAAHDVLLVLVVRAANSGCFAFGLGLAVVAGHQRDELHLVRR